MIRAIAFDMDDTLLNDARQITPFTLEILRRAASKGIRIIPASGRARASMEGFVQQIGCASAFIACNGAEIYTPDGTLWRQELFTPQQAQCCARFAEAANCYVQCYYGDHFYYAGEERWVKAYAATTMMSGKNVHCLSAYMDRPTPKVLLMAEPERVAELLPKARETLKEIASISCSKPYFLEMNPLKATKGAALSEICRHWGIPREQVMAFGDSLNDVSMLTWAGDGVAMANAREDVKAQVRQVCGSNQEDGVARYIQALLLD